MSKKAAAAPGGPYISAADAATYLGVSSRTVRNMLADGRLKGYRLGDRVVRLSQPEIDAALQAWAS